MVQTFDFISCDSAVKRKEGNGAKSAGRDAELPLFRDCKEISQVQYFFLRYFQNVLWCTQ